MQTGGCRRADADAGRGGRQDAESGRTQWGSGRKGAVDAEGQWRQRAVGRRRQPGPEGTDEEGFRGSNAAMQKIACTPGGEWLRCAPQQCGSGRAVCFLGRFLPKLGGAKSAAILLPIPNACRAGQRAREGNRVSGRKAEALPWALLPLTRRSSAGFQLTPHVCEVTPRAHPMARLGTTGCPGGGIGRRAGFRYLWPQGRGSSSLLLGTRTSCQLSVISDRKR